MAKNSAQRAEDRARTQEKADQAAGKRKQKKVTVNEAALELVKAVAAQGAKPKSGDRQVPLGNVQFKNAGTVQDPSHAAVRKHSGSTVLNPSVAALVNGLDLGGDGAGVSGSWAPAPSGLKPVGSGVRSLGGWQKAGPAAGLPGLSPLDELLAGLPPIDQSTYTAPFAAARDGAQKAHDTVLPAIGGNFDRLAEQAAATSADAQGQMGLNREALVKQLAASQAELAGFAAQAAGGPHVTDPTLVSGGAAQTAALAAAQASSGDNRLALADRFSQISQQSDQSRTQDAALAESNALSNASTNLQELLGQIGVKEAGALQQFQADSQDRALDVYKLKSDAASQATDDALKMAEAEDKRTTAVAAQAKSMATTAKQDWEANYESFLQEYPDASEVFEKLTDEFKGSGGTSYAKAKRELLAQSGALESGANPWGKRFNIAKIDSWLKAHYDVDKTKRLSAAARAELGI